MTRLLPQVFVTAALMLGVVTPQSQVLAQAQAQAQAQVQANPGPIAEILCASAHDMRHRLIHRFHAHLVWQGLRSPDQIIELWLDENGDWTLAIAYAGGKRCIVAMGTALTGFSDLS